MPDDNPTDIAEILLVYLDRTHESLLRSVVGLSEHDLRRPLTPTGTNLLGLVKHVASVELGYLGDCVGRPHGLHLPWDHDAAYDRGEDMYAAAEESSEELLDLLRRAWHHGRVSVRTLGLDAPAHVPWWPVERRTTTLGRLLVHLLEEIAHHAGHADIRRESLDGQAGRDRDAIGDEDHWAELVGRIQAAADAHR